MMIREVQLKELLRLAGRGNFSGVLKLGEGDLQEEIDRLAANGFSGALVMSFKEFGKLNSQWLIFIDGRLRAIVLERDVASTRPKLELLENLAVEVGAAEVLEFTHPLKQGIVEILGDYSVTIAPKTEATQEVTLDRELLLKKYRIRVDERELEFLVNEFRKDEKAQEIFEALKKSLSRLVGNKMAEKLIKSEAKKQGIDPENIKMHQLEKFINGVFKMLKLQIGTKKAEAFKRDIIALAEGS